MKKREFDPAGRLGDRIAEMDRQELCQLAVKLCNLIREESGTREYRGGVFPENISLQDGEPALGPASEKDWEGQELLFLPPELYWNGKRGSFSDVYALGLLLYYGLSKGRLPFEGQCRDPLQRRMSGQNFSAPKAAGRRLGEIVEKATRFNSEERYKNVEELQIMLDNVVKNQFLDGANSAQAIFHKEDGELSDLERIMVEIIEQGGEEPEPQEPETPEPEAPGPAEPRPGPEEEPEQIRLYEPSHGRQAPPLRQPIPILTVEEHPELEPVVLDNGPAKPAVQYGKSAQREKKIAQKAKKRSRRPVVVLLVCAVAVAAALVVNAFLRDTVWKPEATPTPDIGGQIVDPNGVMPNLSMPTPEPAPTPIPTPEPTAPPATVSRYEIYQEDLSWTEAQARCVQLGGHLAVITSQEEYESIVAQAQNSGATRLWIGLHRSEGVQLWETGESNGYYLWDVAAGEPSFNDGYDGTPEDYVMLWFNNGGWYYNDSRNDPVADYPGVYRGTMGFVCEFETAAP